VSDGSLVIFTKASAMLAEADTMQKAKELRDLSLTAADWAKRKGMGQAAVQYARGYALEAERRMGEILAKTPRAKGTRGQQLSAGPGRGKKTGGHVMSPPVSDTPTLTDIGITKRESTQAQMLASLPRKVFDAIRDGLKTLTQANRELKESKRKARRRENAALVESTPSPLKSGARFATIVVDPPWDWGDEGDCDQLGRARPTYETMPLEKLLELPVDKLADVDCHLYLWITNRSLPKGFALLEKWGFRYVTCLTWCKPSIGMGNYFRGQTEQVLFGVKGSQPLLRKDVGTWFAAPRGKQHSSKPDKFFDLIESCSPAPRLEMFAREKRNGWTLWGADAPA